MGFIYSTDKIVTERLANKWKLKTTIDYVSFNGSKGTATGKLVVPSKVAAKAQIFNAENHVTLGYDALNNEIVIVPNGGNFTMYKTDKNSGTIACSTLKFLLAVGFAREDIPYGRYEALVDTQNVIHVYLNRPLNDDEQSGKMKGKVYRYREADAQ